MMRPEKETPREMEPDPEKHRRPEMRRSGDNQKRKQKYQGKSLDRSMLTNKAR